VYPALGTPPVVMGSGCGVESEGPGAMASHVQTQAGNDINEATSPIASFQVASSTEFELDWSASTNLCSGTLIQSATKVASVPAAFPAGGLRFGLRGLDVGIFVYAVAGWGRCP
jgi:hypothetical protein